jgi:hypothetical protein
MTIYVCCKPMFQVFHLDVSYDVWLYMYVSSVFDVLDLCCKCFIWMLQKSIWRFHMLLWLYTYVSSVSFISNVCCKCFIWMFQKEILGEHMLKWCWWLAASSQLQPPATARASSWPRGSPRGPAGGAACMQARDRDACWCCYRVCMRARETERPRVVPAHPWVWAREQLVAWLFPMSAHDRGGAGVAFAQVMEEAQELLAYVQTLTLLLLK